VNHSGADDPGTHLAPAAETTARARKRYFVLVEVDVLAAGSGEEYDDALRRAYSTIGSQLWGDPFPEDATLDVGEVEDEQETESETGD
jgi:hypothetical protein